MSSGTEMEFHDLVQGTLRSIESIELKISGDFRHTTSTTRAERDGAAISTIR